MKVFLSVAAVLMVLLGGGWLLVPEAMLGRWGVKTDSVGVFLGRRYGTMLLGYATILWLARGAGPSSARSAILSGGALVAALVATVGVTGVVSGTIGPGGWPTVFVEAVLAGGFVYFLLAGRKEVHRTAD